MRLVTSLFLLCMTTVSLPALAGRPFTTEDAGVLARGECEIEASYARAREAGSDTEKSWWLQPGCGVGLRTQLAIGAGSATLTGARTSNHALLGKTWLKELTDDSTGVAIAYGAGRTKAPGDKYRYDTASINGVVTHPWQGLLLHANLGWARSRLDDSTATTWAFAIEKEDAFGPVDIGIETYGEDRGAAWVQVGARWKVVPDRFNLDASWGAQTGGAKGRLLTLGAKLIF